MLKKKIWANFQIIVEVFTQIIFNMLSNIWVWDPGSGIRKKPIPDPGSRGQKGTGSRIRIRNTVWISASENLQCQIRSPRSLTLTHPSDCFIILTQCDSHFNIVGLFPFLVFAPVLTLLTPPTNCSFVVVYSIWRYILSSVFLFTEGRKNSMTEKSGRTFLCIKN
jgi:hypothetical protein